MKVWIDHMERSRDGDMQSVVRGFVGVVESPRPVIRFGCTAPFDETTYGEAAGFYEAARVGSVDAFLTLDSLHVTVRGGAERLAIALFGLDHSDGTRVGFVRMRGAIDELWVTSSDATRTSYTQRARLLLELLKAIS